MSIHPRVIRVQKFGCFVEYNEVDVILDSYDPARDQKSNKEKPFQVVLHGGKTIDDLFGWQPSLGHNARQRLSLNKKLFFKFFSLLYWDRFKGGVMRTLRSRLEDKIQRKHILEHSFFTRWGCGQLSSEEIKGYAKECYIFEKEFPRFLSALHSKFGDPQLRMVLLENLLHQERGNQNQLEIWARFAEGLGVERSELDEHFFSDETQHLLEEFRNCVNSDNPIDGLAALFAYERQQPDVARTKISGLERFYGWEDQETVGNFKNSQSEDVYHAEAEATLLAELCRSEEDEERAVQVVEKTLNTLYDFLDGVERRYRH